MYLYETHLHTAQGSLCARTQGRDYADFYKRHGYAGFAVTDHFYRGNCAVERSLPWADFVARFCRGYEDARDAGERQGLNVFFGWEENFAGDEHLIYGLDKSWLLSHPDIRCWDRAEYLRRVRGDGALVIQAHPFRERRYISGIHLCGAMTDAVETGNMGNKPQEDALAAQYAKQRGLRESAGNDMHEADDRLPPRMGLLLSEQAKSVIEFCANVKRGAYTPQIPDGRHQLITGRECTSLPVTEYSAEGLALTDSKTKHRKDFGRSKK